MDKQRSLPKHATAALAALSSNARNTIFVVSGYTRAQLDPVLGAIPGLGIAAEHGFHFRYAKSTAAAVARSAAGAGGTTSQGAQLSPKTDTWHSLAEGGDEGWKEIALNLMRVYTQRTNGSRTITNARSSDSANKAALKPSASPRTSQESAGAVQVSVFYSPPTFHANPATHNLTRSPT